MKYLLIVLFLFVVGCSSDKLEVNKIESVKVGDVYQKTWKDGNYSLSGSDIRTIQLEQGADFEKYKVSVEEQYEIKIFIFTVKEFS